jgi:hypothetical protein
MRASREPTGVLVIRVWLEHGGLRARIIRSLDIEMGEPSMTVVSGAQEIEATVAHWLHRFIAAAGPATPV